VISTPARRKALVSGWKLKTGQPFRQADWDDAKQSLLADLLAVDYAAARLQDTRAEVDPEARRVDLRVARRNAARVTASASCRSAVCSATRRSWSARFNQQRQARRRVPRGPAAGLAGGLAEHAVFSPR
jgi:hypothetical protein